jgi:hypothetical protein
MEWRFLGLLSEGWRLPNNNPMRRPDNTTTMPGGMVVEEEF